ncbi:hypothetical protein NXX77_00275 [Phocaeicola dorei]|nr:hypothetical protein [Phocaeicola dorei]
MLKSSCKRYGRESGCWSTKNVKTIGRLLIWSQCRTGLASLLVIHRRWTDLSGATAQKENVQQHFVMSELEIVRFTW